MVSLPLEGKVAAKLTDEVKNMQHNKDLTQLAQKLRREMTKEEQQLWYRFLRQYPIQFKRQSTCGQYILDFYCSKAKLAVEIDGSYHGYSETVENDKARTEYLNSIGIVVMRFPNRDIWQNLDRVCKQIDFMVKERIIMLDKQPHPSRQSRATFPKGEG